MPFQSSYEITEAIGSFSKIDILIFIPWTTIFWNFESVTPNCESHSIVLVGPQSKATLPVNTRNQSAEDCFAV